jgi:hypothetical protein
MLLQTALAAETHLADDDDDNNDNNDDNNNNNNNNPCPSGKRTPVAQLVS